MSARTMNSYNGIRKREAKKALQSQQQENHAEVIREKELQQEPSKHSNVGASTGSKQCIGSKQSKQHDSRGKGILQVMAGANRGSHKMEQAEEKMWQQQEENTMWLVGGNEKHNAKQWE